MGVSRGRITAAGHCLSRGRVKPVSPDEFIGERKGVPLEEECGRVRGHYQIVLAGQDSSGLRTPQCYITVGCKSPASSAKRWRSATWRPTTRGLSINCEPPRTPVLRPRSGCFVLRARGGTSFSSCCAPGGGGQWRRPLERRPVGIEGLRTFLLHRLPAWQVPRHWRILDALPVNGRGKLPRAQLRQIFGVDTGHESRNMAP